MRVREILAVVVGVVLLAACSPGGSGTRGTATSKATNTGTIGADAGKKNTQTKSQQAAVTLSAYGFGQADAYVQGIAIATTNSESSVGEFVTVSANFLDKSGAIIATEQQIEQFSWVGQKLVLPIWLDLSDKKSVTVAKMEPSVSISHNGSADAKPALPVLKSTEVTNSTYSGTTASFAFKNDSGTDLKDLRVGVVCYDKAGRIIGGFSEYPDLAPKHQTIRIDSEVVASRKPKACKAFMNYGDM